MKGVWVGTSGWSYKSWASTFYPPKWTASNQLGYYVTQFPTVEINATFYRLPIIKMAQDWHDKAPEGFVFAVKGSRYLTHMKKLVDVESGLERFLERIDPLRGRMGPILWQLPPFLHKSPERLEEFLQKVPKGVRHAVEFRHASWICDEVFDVLHRHKAACVWLSSGRMPMDFTVTADFVYARFHGLEGGAAHDYTREELEPWAEHLSEAAQKNRPCYVYFNNDVNTRAPLNAKALMEMVGEAAVQPFEKREELVGV